MDTIFDCMMSWAVKEWERFEKQGVWWPPLFEMEVGFIVREFERIEEIISA